MRCHQVARLVGDALERGANQVRAIGGSGDARDHPARAGIPVRRAQAHERGHEIDAAAIGHRCRQLLRFRRGAQRAQLIAQPLHGRAGDEDAAFDARTARCRPPTPRACPAGDSSRPADGRPCASGRSSRCRRCSWKGRGGSRPGPPAPPAGRPRCRRSEWLAPRCSAAVVPGHAARRHDPRQHGARDVEGAEQVVVPIAGRQVHEHGARRVGRIGGVHRAVGELPDQPGVDVAEAAVRHRGPWRARPGTWSRIQRILLPEKYASITRPVLAAMSGPRGGVAPVPCRSRRCGGIATRWRAISAGPCARSQTTVVSRWLVMPMAAMSRGGDAHAAPAGGARSRSARSRSRGRPAPPSHPAGSGR